jgi:hypothetical protein
MKVIQIQKYINCESLNNLPELILNLGRLMECGEKICLRTSEGFSFEQNGLFDALDCLCGHYGYPHSDILIETNNLNEKHDKFIIKESLINIDFANFNKEITEPPFNGDNTLGMFIGRGTAERIYAVLRLRRSPLNPHAISSFNHNFEKAPILNEVARCSNYSDVSVREINKLGPYSDIDSVRPVPIIYPAYLTDQIWRSVYEKIAVEVVCETNTWHSSFFITEKVLRPMYYRRPFVVVGSRHYLQNLKNMGFRTFDNVFDNTYDMETGMVRVDHIFNMLEHKLFAISGNELLEKCKSDIEHNYSLLMEIGKKHARLSLENPNYYADLL